MWEPISVALGILGGAITMTGILIRYTLVPYLEKRMLERLNVVLTEVLSTKAEIIAAGRMFEGHIESAQREHDEMWKSIRERKLK